MRMASAQNHPQTPPERRALVIELIEGGHGGSQQALVDALEGRGVSVTQATLSRDLRALGAVKGPGGYRMPRGASSGSPDPLAQAMGQWLDSVTAAQNLVVLKTPPGGASPLAVVLDRHAPDGVVGTIAGDDTILVIMPSNGEAAKFASAMVRHAEGQAA